MRLRKNVTGMSILFLTTIVITFVLLPGSVAADYWYKDKNSPTGIPDFGQDDKQLRRQDCCMAAAFANSLWYFDHHGYPCLVDHTNPNNHEQNWQGDSQKLINDLIDQIYGNEQKKIPARGNWGVTEYIKQRKHYYCQDRKGLHQQWLRRCNANYTAYKEQLQACEDVILGLIAHVFGVEGMEWLPDWDHCLTGAGIDPENKKLIVSNPWGSCHHDQPKPVSETYYDDYEIFDVTKAQDKICIIDAELLKGIRAPSGGGIDYAMVDSLYIVSPKEKPSTDVKGKQSHLPEKNSYRYEYTITNKDYTAVTKFALEVRTPFDLGSVTSPHGWKWQIWDPSETPELVAAPGHNEPYEWEPNWSGILWMTETNPILLGGAMNGFSYEASDIYPPDEFVTLCGLYDCAETGSSACGVFVTSGPTLPEVPVGGISLPIVPAEKTVSLAPYIGLASTIIVATAATAIYVKRVKRRKGKQ